MAFKSVPKANYDAGRDLLDQVPPEILGGALLALLLVAFGGAFWFVRRHKAEMRAELRAAASDN